MITCPVCGTKDCSHLKAVLKKMKDGKGGPGDPLAPTNPIAPSNPLPAGASNVVAPSTPPMPSLPPMMPSPGISATGASYTPQQQMQMSMQGMQPIGSSPVPPLPAHPMKLSNKPHSAPRGSGAHKMKGMKKASLKSALKMHKPRRAGF